MTSPPPAAPVVPKRPRVDVAFCIDSTASMQPHIDAVKDHVRNLMVQVCGWKSHPIARMAVVTYRDRGDEYLTKTARFTENVEKIHGFLSELVAAGGGDPPEHMTAGLRECVERLAWSAGDRTLKLIYLIGDAPTHTDYSDGDYRPVARSAHAKGIVVNTVGCSKDRRMIRQWKEIAKMTDGEFSLLGGERAPSAPSGPTPSTGATSSTADLGGTIRESVEAIAKRRGFLY